MLTCNETTPISGLFTKICCRPVIPNAQYCRLHIELNPSYTTEEDKDIEIKQADIPITEIYLNTELSLELSDKFETVFHKIKYMLLSSLRKTIQNKYNNDSLITYGDINTAFDTLILKTTMQAHIKDALKQFVDALKLHGWNQYEKYSSLYTIVPTIKKSDKSQPKISLLKSKAKPIPQLKMSSKKEPDTDSE
jgi:hypothetical protein